MCGRPKRCAARLRPLSGVAGLVFGTGTQDATTWAKMEPGRGRVESDKRSFIVSIKIMIILSVKWLTHFSRFAPLKIRYWSQEGNMAPKPKSKLAVEPQLVVLG